MLPGWPPRNLVRWFLLRADGDREPGLILAHIGLRYITKLLCYAMLLCGTGKVC